MRNNYTQFVQYTPTDAQPATLYWKSKEGADWRAVKEILAQDSSLTAIMYNHETGKIEQVAKDLSTVIPIGKSVLIISISEFGQFENLLIGYIIYEGEIVEVGKTEIYEQQWEKIKQIRDEKSQGGTFVKSINKWFHTDPKSLVHYLGLNQQRMMGSYSAVTWKTMDGSYVRLSDALLGEVSNQVINNELLIFGIAEQHKSMMEAYTNPLEYTEAVMNTLWPQTYDESIGDVNV